MFIAFQVPFAVKQVGSFNKLNLIEGWDMKRSVCYSTLETWKTRRMEENGTERRHVCASTCVLASQNNIKESWEERNEARIQLSKWSSLPGFQLTFISFHKPQRYYQLPDKKYTTHTHDGYTTFHLCHFRYYYNKKTASNFQSSTNWYTEITK